MISRDKTLIRSQGDGEEHKKIPVYAIEIASTSTKHGNRPNKIPNNREISSTNKTNKELPDLSHFMSKLKKGQSLSCSLMAAPDPLLLSAPPDDFDQREKFLMLPTEAFRPSDIQKYSTSNKRREPKFVPYEPYKGCVKPIININKLSQNCKDITVNEKPKSNPCVNFNDVRSSVVENESESNKLTSIICDFENERMKWENENTNLLKENEDLKKKINKIQKEYSTSQQQLSTHSQINSELKKLLLASVGEEVYSRVQSLTEDKTRMASMIRKYSEKVDKDYEERERILIQCDVWRSKFLASSVLIDELEKWKSVLLQRFNSAKEALKLILDERNVAHPNLVNTYKYVYQVREAFDPLHSDSPVASTLDSCDSLSLCVANANISETVRDRLLGDLGRAVAVTALKLPQETRTPGEKLALQTLDDDLDPSGTLSSCTKERTPSQRFHPHANYDRITMNCCAKCNGDIIVI